VGGGARGATAAACLALEAVSARGRQHNLLRAGRQVSLVPTCLPPAAAPAAAAALRHPLQHHGIPLHMPIHATRSPAGSCPTPITLSALDKHPQHSDLDRHSYPAVQLGTRFNGRDAAPCLILGLHTMVVNPGQHQNCGSLEYYWLASVQDSVTCGRQLRQYSPKN
jgi:hypothetical protein